MYCLIVNYLVICCTINFTTAGGGGAGIGSSLAYRRECTSKNVMKIIIAILSWTTITTITCIFDYHWYLIFIVHHCVVSIQVLRVHQCYTKKTPLINSTEAQNISNGSELGAVQPVNLTIFDDWQSLYCNYFWHRWSNQGGYGGYSPPKEQLEGAKSPM